MVDFDILDEHGSGEQELRAMFQVPYTGDELVGDPLKAYEAALKRHKQVKQVEDLSEEREKSFRLKWHSKQRKARECWEKRINNRIEEGRLNNFRNYTWYYAADLAWDGPAFKEQIPLMLYAQGKIEIQEAAKKIESSLGEEEAAKFIERDPENKEGIQAINVTRLGESIINLVRPYITRKKAALMNKYDGLYPWLSYESRSKTMPSKIRAAVTSQRIEMVTDMQGYRHEFGQWCHKMLMYSGQWGFVSHPWMRQKSMRKVGETRETYVVKEGPKIVAPHPTRVFYDMAHAPASINTDTGCKYCGFWDILRYGEVKGNPNYFNDKNIRFTQDHDELMVQHKEFFDAYYATSQSVKFAPTRTAGSGLDARRNERKAISGILSQSDEDCYIYLTQYYERIIPKQVGLGSYPYPVWVKLTVANDQTVVRARILPSRPAFYMGHNEDDSRAINPGLAHEILPYQDQAQALVSQMFYLMRLEQLLIVTIDTDLVKDKTMRNQIFEYLKGQRTRAEAFGMEWSGSELRQGLKINPEAPVKFHKSNVQALIGDLLGGINKILELLDRNTMMSPQELGQFAQRETSATENMIVEKTTNALHSYTSIGPDEARAALKVILYESFVAHGEDEVPTPVTATFPRRIVEAAGFKFYDDTVGDEEFEEEPEAEGRTVVATKEHMAHDYIFNSRDGVERTVSPEAAKSLYQFVVQILQNGDIMRLFGWKQVSEMISEVFRLSGSVYTIQLPDNLPEGGPGDFSDEMKQFAEQFQQQFTQLAEGLQQQVADVAEGQEVNEANLKELEEEVANAFERIQSNLQSATPPTTETE